MSKLAVAARIFGLALVVGNFVLMYNDNTTLRTIAEEYRDEARQAVLVAQRHKRQSDQFEMLAKEYRTTAESYHNQWQVCNSMLPKEQRQ
jgi:hypothetical protein